MMIQESDRLDIIFAALNAGKFTDEIDRMLEKAGETPNVRRAKKRARQENAAAERVASVLRQIDNVLYVRRADDNAEKFGDRFLVGIKIPGRHEISQVTADIRLHADALRRAQRRISQEMHLHKDAVENYLVKQKMVLLHTKLPDEAIILQFGQQWKRILKAQNLWGL